MIEQALTRYHIRGIHEQEHHLADNLKTDRANAQFAKLQRAADGKKAMSDYEAEAAAVRAKTERLRAQRLARDAAIAAQPAAAPKTTAKKKTKTSAKTLSDWLNAQKSAGRKT